MGLFSREGAGKNMISEKDQSGPPKYYRETLRKHEMSGDMPAKVDVDFGQSSKDRGVLSINKGISREESERQGQMFGALKGKVEKQEQIFQKLDLSSLDENSRKALGGLLTEIRQDLVSIQKNWDDEKVSGIIVKTNKLELMVKLANYQAMKVIYDKRLDEISGQLQDKHHYDVQTGKFTSLLGGLSGFFKRTAEIFSKGDFSKLIQERAEIFKHRNTTLVEIKNLHLSLTRIEEKQSYRVAENKVLKQPLAMRHAA